MRGMLAVAALPTGFARRSRILPVSLTVDGRWLSYRLNGCCKIGRAGQFASFRDAGSTGHWLADIEIGPKVRVFVRGQHVYPAFQCVAYQELQDSVQILHRHRPPRISRGFASDDGSAKACQARNRKNWDR
jgi:hypothetical protein